jgi:hypothetical protein
MPSIADRPGSDLGSEWERAGNKRLLFVGLSRGRTRSSMLANLSLGTQDTRFAHACEMLTRPGRVTHIYLVLCLNTRLADCLSPMGVLGGCLGRADTRLFPFHLLASLSPSHFLPRCFPGFPVAYQVHSNQGAKSPYRWQLDGNVKMISLYSILIGFVLYDCALSPVYFLMMSAIWGR